MDGILDNLPEPAKIRARLAREDLVAPLRHLAKNFIGREPELDQLRGYLGDVSQRSAIRRGKKPFPILRAALRLVPSRKAIGSPSVLVGDSV